MTRLSALKGRRLICTCALAISALAPARHLFAQRPSLLVTIPFPFQNGDHNFPAGTYVIQRTSDRTLLLRDPEGNHVGVIMTVGEQRAAAQGAASVVFHRYGEHYFLSDVWLANSLYGNQLMVSRAEKALREPGATRPAPGNQVALNVPQP